MRLSRVAVVLAFVFAALVAASAAGPVQVSYVYSDSMEPTVPEGAGYVLVPADVQQGDVVTFWSAERGTHVTHRVVGETDAGLLTQGDANPTTDQAAGLPPVERDAIVGELWTVAGRPVVVPGVGPVVAALAANRLLLLAVLGGALAAGGLRGRSGRFRRRVPRAGDVVAALCLAAFVAATALVVAGGTASAVTYTATDGSSATGSQTLAVGAEHTETASISRSGSPALTTVVRAEGMTVAGRERNASAVRVTLRVPPPETAGPVHTSVAAHQYPATLPRPALRRLDAVHPLAAAAASVGVAVTALYAACRLAIDPRAPIRLGRARAPRWWSR